ncbi:unnamed protein product [Symbiodinium sp. CCMP2592]|nr:unnamed protein product [Symbiodinium sp. CCMP2592]
MAVNRPRSVSSTSTPGALQAVPELRLPGRTSETSGLEISERSRASTWAPSFRFYEYLDEWLFPVEDSEAHRAWTTSGGRQAWVEEVQAQGGFRSWLLGDVVLSGMKEKNYLLGLRWLSGVAARRPDTAQKRKEVQQARCIAEEIELDMHRTFPGHPREAALQMAVRDVLRMLCCARNADTGYTQGLNFTAAALCSVMPRDDAFWCLAALSERLAGHFLKGGSLQGVLVDSDCIDWLVGKLDPQGAAAVRALRGYSPTLLYSKPLCTLLAGCGLPIDAALQCWQAILAAPNPRILMLRILAAFVLEVDLKILPTPRKAAVEVSVFLHALQKCFQATYDAKTLVAAAEYSALTVSDVAIQEAIQAAEDRVRQRAAEARARRSRSAAARFRRQAGGAVPKLLADVRTLCTEVGDVQVTEGEFVAQLGTLALEESTASAFFSSVFSDLDSAKTGRVLQKQALISLALLLGDTLSDRVATLLMMLDQGSGVDGISHAEFAALVQALQEENTDRAWAISEDIVKDCDLDQKAFMKALLALPPLALETMSLDATPKASSQSSFTSAGTSFGSLMAPTWVANGGVNCQSCSVTFTCVRRRHHCRACGRLLCNACSLQRLPLSILGYLQPVRVCDDCCFVLCPGQS